MSKSKNLTQWWCRHVALLLLCSVLFQCIASAMLEWVAHLFRFGSFRETSARDPYQGVMVFCGVLLAAVGFLFYSWGHRLVRTMMNKM
jgi:protein-S-isoprenylcysteine O-methyltransferase Ste14